MKEKGFRGFIFESIGLVLGCIFMSIGINMFLKPYTIAPGGLSGLSMVIGKVTGLPMSIVMLVIGIPLIVFSVKILGIKNSIKTLIGMSVFSAILSITSYLSNVHVTEDVLLCSISGALCLGIGLGIILKMDASTGGTDLIALMLNKVFPNVPLSKFMVMLDGMVVISAGLASKNLETALYSGVALYIIVKLVDAIVSDFNYSKAFMIISNEPNVLRDGITREVKRGVTFLQGKGGYTNEDKNVLLVVVSKNEEVHLKKVIKNIDPSAFIIVSDVHEVLGEGFKAIA
ncbi:membrane protein [[Clostridium] sordellii]|uniref:Membrane protein n=1 Tax=Paraclostridium sordellii TaxID=1505 RepID=A0ABM9RPN1_PARSO|nr:YitT family protein [Paeniclostridium sordellii]CEJ74002.1 putative membrane protein [[Clostridium] sordellii] [Paeniclostridium sordellii]CEN69547.1 membrane protein [[Clostridium] sordellii] [Paeniclostridium sordellii]CEN72815.1 membrane protein [[Clostridium] sordellii] [Paeniclostridium sordellii]CEO24841.1 membrane protein [[Clostridium] sordellii] [Paeniclostridium sordellii]CEP75592.1 membrane protein [[Clostridium] sordellii] [Paeniclostridium sordellii]